MMKKKSKKKKEPTPGDNILSKDNILSEISYYGIAKSGYKVFMRPVLKKAIEDAINKFEDKGDGKQVYDMIRKCPEIVIYSTWYASEFPEFMQLCKCFITLIKRGGLKYNKKLSEVKMEDWVVERFNKYSSYGLNKREIYAVMFDDYCNLPRSHFRKPPHEETYEESFSQLKKRIRRKVPIEAVTNGGLIFSYYHFEDWLYNLIHLRGRLCSINSRKYSSLKDPLGKNELFERMKRICPIMDLEDLEKFLKEKAVEMIQEEVYLVLSREVKGEVKDVKSMTELVENMVISGNVKKRFSESNISKFIELDEDIFHKGLEEAKLKHALSVFL